MPNSTSSFSNTAGLDPQTVGEKLSDTASQVKAKVSDLGRTATDKIDENRDAAAGGLEKAAAALHDKAGALPGGEKVTSAAHAAAEKLTATAEYVKEHDVKSMMEDVEKLVKNNPGPALLAAAVVGFLVGRAFTSND